MDSLGGVCVGTRLGHLQTLLHERSPFEGRGQAEKYLKIALLHISAEGYENAARFIGRAEEVLLRSGVFSEREISMEQDVPARA